jgi:hypothetical protein
MTVARASRQRLARWLLSCALLILCSWVQAQPGWAFRCGGGNVSIGDWQGEVLYKCGDPSWSAGPWEEVYARGKIQRKEFSSVQISLWVEEWMYNLGPTQFVRYLRFENGRLVNIRTGGYGY